MTKIINSTLGLIDYISVTFSLQKHGPVTGTLVFNHNVYMEENPGVFGSAEICPHCDQPIGDLEQLYPFHIVIEYQDTKVTQTLRGVILMINVWRSDTRGNYLPAGTTYEFTADELIRKTS